MAANALLAAGAVEFCSADEACLMMQRSRADACCWLQWCLPDDVVLPTTLLALEAIKMTPG
jgi:hypothetical protein